ncbi:MAG: exopolyphosphatase [Bacteroidetes bacterium]|nr:exopolyphosphatase [Bacteroidota bacterium]MBS1630568.1 exopolyphosphatase [Bacteroidota bacterium]
MNLAAIDIGSNAARLLISQATPYEGGVDFTKLSLLRIPLRLGMDVFTQGRIGPEKEQLLTDTLRCYALLMKIYQVEALAACATSAMRDAANGTEIIEKLKTTTGIELRILSGEEEADVLFQTHIAENRSLNKSYLYIDVGGGSTELSFFSKNELVFKQSFNIGTIRLLQGLVSLNDWEQMKAFVKDQLKGYEPVEAIGTGGNINKVFSLSKRKEGKTLSLELLRDYHKELNAASLSERMHRYQLRADRADVIVPALQVYISVMRWAGADEIFVPKIGLADGLVRMLYQELNPEKR